MDGANIFLRTCRFIRCS